MQITVKVSPRSKKAPAAVVRDCVKTVQPAAKVEEVFPGVESGRRAGLVTVKLPDTISQAESKAVLRSLREDADIEYAEPAASRKARSRGLSSSR
jgi:hypothetical protein